MSFNFGFNVPQRLPTAMPWAMSPTMQGSDLLPNQDPDPAVQEDIELHRGCCQEAEQAEAMWLRLEGLRMSLPPGNHVHLIATTEGIRGAGQILRQIADLSQLHKDRIPVVLHYLQIGLPCLQRTLKDLQRCYEDQKMSIDNRWRKMYHMMKDEGDGLLLPQRFILYNQFFTSLKDLLIRSPNFELNMLEAMRQTIMKLRGTRNIPPPDALIGSPVRFDPAESPSINPSIHWAEHIFSLPLPSRTNLKTPLMSKSFGPHQPWANLEMELPTDTKLLFRRPFDEDQISLSCVIIGHNKSPYLLIRTFHLGQAWFSIRGVHELCIEREGSSLQFRSWSHQDRCATPWAILHFKTYEELVLMHSTILSLKSRNKSTISLDPEEFGLKGERKLFQARIKDDAYKHSLIVYEDRATRCLRLHAAVWDGELRQSPVWTAFVTDHCTTHMRVKLVSDLKVHIRNIQPYVFCKRYRQQNQRVEGSADAFEIHFAAEEASHRFLELFMDKNRPRLSNRPAPRKARTDEASETEETDE